MDVPGLKAWIEELSAKNKILENENNGLKDQLQTVTMENALLKTEVSVLRKSPKPGPVPTTSDSRDGTDTDVNSKKVIQDLESSTKVWKDLNEVLRDQTAYRQTTRPRKYLLTCDGIRQIRKEEEEKEKMLETFPKTNPMVIQEVVRILMGFVHSRDLAACRRVCNLWKHEATKQIQEKHVFHLSFFYNDKVKEFLDHAATSFPNFRKVHVNLKGSDGPPNSFSNLFMNHGKSLHHVEIQFGYEQNLNMDNFRDLFLASFEQIQTLKIEGLRCLLIHQARIFGPNHTMKILPHLTSLNIEMIHPCILNHRETQVFIDLLRIAPNLTTLYWKSKPQNDLENNGTRTMLESLLEVDPPNFQNLYLNSPISNYLVALVANSKLKLNKLYFTELEGFEVTFSSGGTNSNILPKRVCYAQVPAMDLKRHLENRLEECGQVYCTTLLKTFLSSLSAKLAER